MARRFRIRINMPLLREQLSRSDGTAYTAEQVHRWLLDAGLRPVEGGPGDTWVADEANLGHLNPSEVLEADLLDDPHGG